MARNSIACQVSSVLSGWGIERDVSIVLAKGGISEHRIWSDELGLLEVSVISSTDSPWFRLRQVGQVAVDVSFSQRLLVERPVSSSIPRVTLDHFLIDQVLPRILAHEGQLVLHAGAVRYDNRAIVLLGQSGRGKSTLSASLDLAGFELIGDDALIISKEDRVFRTRAVYPSLRLLPDSLDALFQDRPPTAAVAHYTLKERVNLPIRRGRNTDTLPIAAIFSIMEPSSDCEIHVRQMSPAATCMAIITNSFALDPTEKELSRKKLADASKLANEVKGYEISYPRDYTRLPDVHAAIFETLASADALMTKL